MRFPPKRFFGTSTLPRSHSRNLYPKTLPALLPLPLSVPGFFLLSEAQRNHLTRICLLVSLEAPPEWTFFPLKKSLCFSHPPKSRCLFPSPPSVCAPRRMSILRWPLSPLSMVSSNRSFGAPFHRMLFVMQEAANSPFWPQLCGRVHLALPVRTSCPGLSAARHDHVSSTH